MNSSHPAISTLLLFGIALFLGCSGGEISREDQNLKDNIPAYYVDADGSNASLVRDTTDNRFPYLLMEDGRITLNDRCPVRKVPLNRRLPALFVNNMPIGFC